MADNEPMYRNVGRGRVSNQAFDANMYAAKGEGSARIERGDNNDVIMEGRLEKNLKKSHRIFGIPHQFIESADPRIGKTSNLGRCFAEKILLEAPIIAIQPGKPEFLPSIPTEGEHEFFDAVIHSSRTDSDNILEKWFNESSLKYKSQEDMLMYYRHKSCYQEMMSKVNILCRLMAMFLGIQDKELILYDESGNMYKTTYGRIDWRDYQISSLYGSIATDKMIKNKEKEKHWWSFISESVESLANDTDWLRFYVDANASFGETNTNNTTTSMLKTYTKGLEEFAKELEFVSGISGIDVDSIAQGTTSSIDNFVKGLDSNSKIGTMLSRITGATKQIIAGGNFLIPDIWSSSDYSKNYSFSITLTTPYGCKEAWFLNIGVPLMHLLCLSLPNQVTANVYKSPYLVKCFSPGWFNCNLGIIDSISVEKGSDQSWGIGGLPNEIKVSLSVRDLYATLAIPERPYVNQSAFLASGMLEFLAVNCGVDLTDQTFSSRLKIWSTLLVGNFIDRFRKVDNVLVSNIKQSYRNWFNILN